MDNPVPAGLAQVMRARSGRWVTVDNDVARALRELDPDLELRVTEPEGFFAVVYHDDRERRKEHLVLTALECDHRIVARCMLIGSGQYDYVAELEKRQDDLNQRLDDEFDESIAEYGARLHHAIRKDRGWNQDRTFFKGDKERA